MATNGNEPTDLQISPSLIEQFMQGIAARSQWDPEFCLTWSDTQEQSALRRMNRDVNRSKPPAPGGCYIETHKDDITKVHAIVVGPKGTPYEGGFFHFLIRFPPDYPSKPPRVKIMTTDDHRVRFNPNLYADGLVCISMLGTWDGPQWTEAHSLYTVLAAIQGLMNEAPYNNEPELQRLGKKRKDKDGYHEFLVHETLRVAVCGMIDKPDTNQIHKLPESLRDKIKELFLENYDVYMKRVEEKIHLDGQTMIIDAFGSTGGRFAFKNIRPRLDAIHKQLSENRPAVE